MEKKLYEEHPLLSQFILDLILAAAVSGAFSKFFNGSVAQFLLKHAAIYYAIAVPVTIILIVLNIIFKKKNKEIKKKVKSIIIGCVVVILVLPVFVWLMSNVSEKKDPETAQTNTPTVTISEAPTEPPTEEPTEPPTPSPTQTITATPSLTPIPDPANNSIYGLMPLQGGPKQETIGTYPLYSGPGKDYFRCGNARVNKKKNTAIYGRQDEWLFIRYKDSALQEFIYGWVTEEAFYGLHLRKYDEIVFGSNTLVIIQPTTARDGTSEDNYEIESFEKGQVVTGLATKADEITETEFIYCEFERKNGQTARGFIPKEAFFEATDTSITKETPVNE